MGTPSPVVRTRPCAICGKPIRLMAPDWNQQYHVGPCLVEALERAKTKDRDRKRLSRTPKETP